MSNGDTPPPAGKGPGRKGKAAGGADPVTAARETVLEGVGREIAASFPGITRLGGQIVAALYLADGALSMDDLCAIVGRSKSNVFSNLRALEAAGIAIRHRASGTRHDMFELKGRYPDVVIGAYLTRLRMVVTDKVGLCSRALRELGDADGPEADALRTRLTTLLRKYERFASVFADLALVTDGPVDLEAILDTLPEGLLSTLATLTKNATS